MHNKILMVLGMHRSGTSLATHWLRACGLEVGDSLLGPGVGNAQGHFEDTEWYQLHRSWLEHRHLPHTGFVCKPVPPLSAEWQNRLRALAAARNARFPDWGWKDPRTCLLLGDYRRLLPEAYSFAVFRNYRATVSSMLQRIVQRKDSKYAALRGVRGWIWFNLRRNRRWRRLLQRDANRFLKVWIFYNRQILAHLQYSDPQRTCILPTAALPRGGDAAIFSKLTRAWGFRLRFTPFSTLYDPELVHPPLDLDSFIEPALLRDADRVMRQLTLRAADELRVSAACDATAPQAIGAPFHSVRGARRIAR